MYDIISEYQTKYRATKKDQIDYDLVFKLAHIQCTEMEIEYIIGCSHSTFQRWKQEDPKLIEALEYGAVDGKIALRRAQFQVAFPDPQNGYRGNPNMLIWLGKQILKQSEKVQVDGGDTPVQIKLIWGDLPKDSNSKENDNIVEDIKNETSTE